MMVTAARRKGKLDLRLGDNGAGCSDSGALALHCYLNIPHPLAVTQEQRMPVGYLSPFRERPCRGLLHCLLLIHRSH